MPPKSKSYKANVSKGKAPKAKQAGTYVIESKSTGKKYVGRSGDVAKRLQQHNSASGGAQWTSQAGNRDWNVVKVYKGNDAKTENAIAKGVIRNEGFANVRGAEYCQAHYERKFFQDIKNKNNWTNEGHGGNSK